MTKSVLEQMIAEFKSKGGKITKCEPSNKSFKTFRGKAGAFNRGAKKVGLQDRNFSS